MRFARFATPSPNALMETRGMVAAINASLQREASGIQRKSTLVLPPLVRHPGLCSVFRRLDTLEPPRAERGRSRVVHGWKSCHPGFT